MILGKFNNDDEKLMDIYLADKFNNGQPLTNNDIYRIASTEAGLFDILKHNGMSRKMFDLLAKLTTIFS